MISRHKILFTRALVDQTIFLKLKKIIKYEDFFYHLQFMSSEGFVTENLHATLG